MRGTYKITAILALCALLASCAVYAEPGTQSPGSNDTATLPPSGAQGTPSPTPSPSPSPASSPAPSPTPVPTPTPTPDPWAGFFTQGGAYVKIGDADNGPWVYRDETLSVTIEKRKLGGRMYFRAEIYAREGTLPFGGFACNDAAGKKRALPYLIARQNGAVFGITGDFVVTGANPKGVMIRQGKVYNDAKKAPTLAVMPDGELKVYDAGKVTARQLLDLGVQDSFAFGPILVRDGKIDKSVYTHRLRQHNWRAAIGQIEPGHYIAIVNPVGVDLADLAQLFVDNGCTVAYNLDGGHSASIVFMGEQLYKQAPGEDNGEQRSLTDMLLIGVSPAVPGPSAPVYCNGLGYNKKYRPQPTDGPIG
jgi:hypothetical protein